MSKLSFRARALDASKPMPIYLAEELPDLPDYSAINRAVPQMPSGMEKEEESEHHLQRAISGTGLIIPTPEVSQVSDLEFYERCYPPDYKMPKQHIHMQPLWEEQEAPEYDIDTEDERWLKQQRHPELTELKFEQMMDKLEKSSGQTVVTLNEAKLLLERSDDLVIAVYDYWLNKRLNTQHPLVLSVKTENRPGQSTNNPYLAFRRRTEKMQTRKNRKNDESSYEKMLKLRRDLARALTLLEFVAKRESAKRELVRLTALIAERRYAAGDFANQLLPEPPPRPAYTVPLASSNFRREVFLPHYPPRPPLTPVDQPRQREKRPYKRRKHRHPTPGAALGLREPPAYTSSEEESGRAEAATPPDDGPFAFRRKPGCYYEMPTTTLYGDPVDPDSPSKDGLFAHELDERHRYTLTSVSQPHPQCVGFARRRAGRGGRVALDRRATPLDDLWPTLPFAFPHSAQYRAARHEEMELETKAHRTPKEMSRDYHTGGKYPWRHAFRRHLARQPQLWLQGDPAHAHAHAPPALKAEPPDPAHALPDLLQHSVNSVKSDISVNARTIDATVRGNLARVVRKRAWSGCSDSYDSDESLQPVEQEFERFITEVNKKWLHFRPKTPPPSPPQMDDPHDDQFQITMDTPIAVELRAAERPPSDALDIFTSAEFTLGQLYPDLSGDADTSAHKDTSDDLLSDNFTGLTEAQVESILSETQLKTPADGRKSAITDAILDELVNNVDARESFLSHGQSSGGRADSGPNNKKAEAFGSSVVTVTSEDSEPMYMYLESVWPPPPPARPAPPAPPAPAQPAPPAPAQPVPTANIIVEEVNEVPHIKLERKRKDDTIEEVQLPHGVQLKTVHTKHSPLKKHIITSSGHRRASDTVVSVASVVSVVSGGSAGSSVSVVSDAPPAAQPQLVTVAVSDSLKMRLQNHLASSQAGCGVLLQNGPFPQSVAVLPAPPPSPRDHAGVATVASVAGVSMTASPPAAPAPPAGAAPPARRVSAPVVQLGGSTLAHKHLQLHPHLHPHHPHHQPLVVAQSHTIHHVAPNKLKVLHAHPLTQTQRTQLLAQNRTIAGLPAVVSLATLGETKTPNTALLKAAPGSVAQLFEIKSGQLGKGPHLVNVVRQPAPGKTTVARLDLNDKKRQVVATFDGTTLKGNIAGTTRPHRVNLSLDGRQIVRATLPAVRAPQLRHQIQLKNRTLQVTPSIPRSATEPSTSITIAAPTKTASIPSSVVANLLQKNVQLPKGGQKIAISGSGGSLAANMQAIAFTTTAQLKARQARLIAQPRPTPVAEIVDASSVGSPSAGRLQPDAGRGAGLAAAGEGEEGGANGAVRRRATDTLPMEVT